ncbi:hypothetical protein ACFSBZ_06725 [Amnibacterium flavum]
MRTELARRVSDDRGSAALEFITAGVLLLVPIVYLVIAMSAIQAATFATEGAARNAARIFATSDTQASAESAAERSVAFALADFGIDSGAARVDVSCTPSAADCLARESLVTVTVRVDVPLPFIPSMVANVIPTSVPVEARAIQRVSTFAVLGP